MLPKPRIVLFAHRFQAVKKQKGMQAADGLFPEIVTVPKERRAWAIPPEPPIPQTQPHCSPHGGTDRQATAPAHLRCSLDTSGHPAQLNAALAVNPHTPPLLWEIIFSLWLIWMCCSHNSVKDSLFVWLGGWQEEVTIFSDPLVVRSTPEPQSVIVREADLQGVQTVLVLFVLKTVK